MRKALLILLFTSILLGNVRSQTDENESIYSVNIYSNIPNALCFIDSVGFSELPVMNYKLPPGTYNILIKSDSPLNHWTSSLISETVEVYSDTTFVFNAKLMYNFTSDPFNAEVFHNDKLLGLTPLRYSTENYLTGSVLLKKEGYNEKSILLDEEIFNYDVKLQHKLGETKNYVITNRKTGFDKPRNWLAIGGFGIATLAGAYTTYTFKKDANNLYDEYSLTGDMSKLNESNSKDRYFTISLIAMQAAIGALIYFLFFD